MTLHYVTVYVPYRSLKNPLELRKIRILVNEFLIFRFKVQVNISFN